MSWTLSQRERHRGVWMKLLQKQKSWMREKWVDAREEHLGTVLAIFFIFSFNFIIREEAKVNCECIRLAQAINLWLYHYQNIFSSIMTISWSLGYLRFVPLIITFLSVLFNFQWSSAFYIPIFPQVAFGRKLLLFSSSFLIAINVFRFYYL